MEFSVSPLGLIIECRVSESERESNEIPELAPHVMLLRGKNEIQEHRHEN